MDIEEWVSQVLAAAEEHRRRSLVRLLDNLRPRAESAWRVFAAEDAEEGIAVGRAGLAALRAERPEPDRLRELAEASDAWATEVGEDGQALDDLEDAGFVHAFTALLTVALFDAAGTEHPEQRLEDVLTGLSNLIDAFPDLEEAFAALE